MADTDSLRSEKTRDYERPEVASLHAAPNASDQLFATLMVRQEARHYRTRLMFRAKILIVVIVLSLLSAGYWLLRIIPEMLGGSSDAVANISTVVGMANAALQIGTAGYFLLARDPDFAQNVLKLLLLVAGLELLMSLVAYGASGWFTLLNMVLLLIAYTQMPLLRYGKDL